MTIACAAAIVLFLACSFFFSGFETGIYSLNKIRLRIWAEMGDLRALRVRALIDDMPGLLVTILVGNNLVNDGASFALILLLGRLGVAEPQYLSTLILTPVIFFFSEALPKSFFIRRPNALVYPTAVFASAAKTLFFPVVVLLRRIVSYTSRGVKGQQTGGMFFTRARIGLVLDQGVREGVVSPELQSLADNIMKMGKTTLKQVMVPLGKTAFLKEGDAPESLVELAKRTDMSRFPVLDRDCRAKGIVHIFDLAVRGGRVGSLDEIIQKPVEFLEDFPVGDALFILQKRKRQMALVVSKEGKVEGIVTIKDLVEEVVGEISAW